MASGRSPQANLQQHLLYPTASPKQSRIGLMAFLTTVMSLLSLLVFGLGWDRGNVFWTWIGFICALVAGIFVQLFINRRERAEGNETGKKNEKGSP